MGRFDYSGECRQLTNHKAKTICVAFDSFDAIGNALFAAECVRHAFTKLEAKRFTDLRFCGN